MHRRRQLIAPLLTAALFVILAVFLLASMSGQQTVVSLLKSSPATLESFKEAPQTGAGAEQLVWTRSNVGKGETLSTYLQRMDVADSLLNPITAAIATQLDPRRIPAGAVIELGWSPEGLQRVTLSHPGRDEYIQAIRDSGKFSAERLILPSDTVLAYYHGTVTNSVYETLLENGGTPQLAVKFFEVFQFTHYFAVDTRRGDTYSFIVEEIRREGKRAGYGQILAARYSGELDTLTAVWKADGTGAGEHFDAAGFSFLRDLLRVPFPAARITSTYGVRKHPISGKVKMHYGVDLAADRGTPVVAAGMGMITRVERNDPGLGNWVQIKHGKTGFETRYGHFDRIAKGIRVGAKVEQGDVIGYVGSTGHATGPHLHYEVFRDGKRIDPLRVKGSPVQQIKGEEYARFLHDDYQPWAYLLDEGNTDWQNAGFDDVSPWPSLLASAFANLNNPN